MSGLFVFPKLPPCDGEGDNEHRPRRLWAEFEFFFGFVGRRLVACDLGCHAAGILSGESAMPWAIVHAQFGWVSTVELDEPTSSRTSTKQTGNIRAWFVSAGISPSSQFTVHFLELLNLPPADHSCPFRRLLYFYLQIYVYLHAPPWRPSSVVVPPAPIHCFT